MRKTREREENLRSNHSQRRSKNMDRRECKFEVMSKVTAEVTLFKDRECDNSDKRIERTERSSSIPRSSSLSQEDNETDWHISTDVQK